MKAPVFLDRDGTINQDVGYIHDSDQFELIPGSAEAIRALNAQGFPVVVISNQAGIAKGIIKEDRMPELHEAFLHMLDKEGAKIDGFYYCPHHPEGTVANYRCVCSCRKPEPGLLQKASHELHLDLPRSYVVGDKISDIQLAHNVGAVAIMVLTGHGLNEQNSYPEGIAPPHFTCKNLLEAVQWIIKQHPK